MGYIVVAWLSVVGQVAECWHELCWLRSDLNCTVLLAEWCIIQALTAIETDSSVMTTLTVTIVSLRTTVPTDMVFLQTNVASDLCNISLFTLTSVTTVHELDRCTCPQ